MVHDTTGLAGLWDAVPAPVPVPESPPAPVPPPDDPPSPPLAPPASPAVPAGAQVSALTQAFAAFRRGWIGAKLTWRQSRRRDGGWIHGIEHWHPPSIADQIAYRDGRGWLPTGQEGTLTEEAGVFYHTRIAIPAMIPAILWLWIWARPFRATCACVLTALLVTVITVVLIHFGVL